jgi:RNA polymerase sigma-70 factor, ECF subfamily
LLGKQNGRYRNTDFPAEPRTKGAVMSEKGGNGTAFSRKNYLTVLLFVPSRRQQASAEVYMGAALSHHDVTQLLRAWSSGDQEALDKLTPLVYRELHRAAKRYMARQQPDHTLQTTALVNEVYLRLVAFKEVSWEDRAHFFAVCAQLMRRILTDWARGQRYQKRGGEARHIPLDEALLLSPGRSPGLVALDEALKVLSQTDARKSQVVELRFYGGLSVEETARVLKVSPETVMRDWKIAKLWLLREMTGGKQVGA